MRTSLSLVLSTLYFVSLSFLMSSCKGKEQPLDPSDPKNAAIAGNVAKPEWKGPSSYDLSSSMTIVAQVDLSPYYASQLTIVAQVDLSPYYASQLDTAKYALSPDDLLAAFSDDECLGVAEKKDSLFFLYVCSPTAATDDQATLSLTIRYYSASLRNVFRSINPIIYINDGQSGTVDNPHKPLFVIDK